MGLLDDAIREHLDLKRRRGADPGEIAREEAEALGPVRREAREDEPEAAAAPLAAEAPALDEPALAYDDDDRNLGYDDEPVASPGPAFDADLDLDRPRPSQPPRTHDDVWAEPEEESATPPHGDPLAHQPTREFSATELGEALGREGHAPDREAPAAREARPTPEPEPRTHDRAWAEPERESATPPHGDPLAHPESQSPPATPAAPAGADAPASDDELEETPDFLQETPEHDRLWFEQKPPKDFDF